MILSYWYLSFLKNKIESICYFIGNLKIYLFTDNIIFICQYENNYLIINFERRQKICLII